MDMDVTRPIDCRKRPIICARRAEMANGNSTDMPSSEQVGNFLCNKCFDIGCVYGIVQMVFVVGIIADFMVITRVVCDRKLRNATFVSIACLALCDVSFLTMNMISTVDRLLQMAFCIEDLGYLTKGEYWTEVQGAIWIAANSHITLIAVVRFLILSYPLKNNRWLSIKGTLITSLVIWCVSAAFFIIKTLIQKNTDLRINNKATFRMSLWGVAFGAPVFVTATLHIVKLYRVKRSRDEAQPGSHDRSYRRMSMIILTVIVCAVTLPIPRLVFLILNDTGYDFGSQQVKRHLQGTGYTLYLLNYSVNPFIYAFMSVTFRRSLMRMCRKKRSGPAGFSSSSNSVARSGTARYADIKTIS